MLWNGYISMAMKKPKKTINRLTEDFHKRVRERWGESIFREIIPVMAFKHPIDTFRSEQHRRQAK